MTTQRAAVEWEGTLARGAGRLTSGSGALDSLGVDLPNRMCSARGRTSPEELLAGAHATCFAMSLGSALEELHRPGGYVRIEASVRLDTTEGHRRVEGVDLEVCVRAAQIDEALLAQAVRIAEERCLLTRALDPSVAVRVGTRLEGAP